MAIIAYALEGSTSYKDNVLSDNHYSSKVFDNK